MWETIFDKMVTRLVQQGELAVTYPDGRPKHYGPGGSLSAGITLKDKATIRGLCTRPDLTLGEAYMDEKVVIENDDI